MAYGQLIEHGDYPGGFIDGIGPACAPDSRCPCGSWASCQCQSCPITLCPRCWWRHSHNTSDAGIECHCPVPLRPARHLFHEAYVVPVWRRGNRRASARVCARCRKVIAGTAQYEEPLEKSRK